MANFATILTNIGLAKISNAIALGQQIALTEMAVGDGNGAPTSPVQTQEALVNEVYRGQLNRLDTDPNNPAYVIAELVIPANVGGWHVHEVGVFDADGDMIAIANFPATYKPQALEGSTRDLVVRVYIEVTNAAAVQLKIDASVVLASRLWVRDNFLALTSVGRESEQVPRNSQLLSGFLNPRAATVVDAANAIIEFAGAPTDDLTGEPEYHVGRRILVVGVALGVQAATITGIDTETSPGNTRAAISFPDSSNLVNEQLTVYLGPSRGLNGSGGPFYPPKSGELGAINYTYCYDDPRRFGAAGDWNGATGTDNLTACENAAASCRRLHFRYDPDGQNDYWLSDSWNITLSNTDIRIDPGVTIRTTTAASTGGHAICFLPPGALETPRDYSAQIENVHIWGGGAVRTATAGANENAIAFVCAKNFSCEGMRVPEAGRKGITAQINCQQGRLRGNAVGTTGDDAITIEGDSIYGVDQNTDFWIEDNIVEAAGGRGLNVTFVSGPNTTRVHSNRNTVKTSIGNGFTYSGIDYLYEDSNVSLSAGGKGFDYFQCDHISSDNPTAISSTENGLRCYQCGKDVEINGPTVVSASAASAGTYDAILIDQPQTTHRVVNPKVSGSNHRYAINSTSASSALTRVIGRAQLTAGTSGTYGNWQPLIDDEHRNDTVSINAGAPTFDFSRGSIQSLTLTTNVTAIALSNAVPGKEYTLIIAQDATGGRTVAGWPAAVKWTAGTTPTITPTASRADKIRIVYDGSLYWADVAAQDMS